MNKTIQVIMVIVTGAVLLIVALGVYKFNFKDSDIYYQACTQEAKLCPDGSAVGRTEANCAFAECPSDDVDLAFVPVKNNRADFTVPISYIVGEKVTYVDGLTIELKKITDSLCPPNANCIWAGEINPVFKITAKDLSEEKQMGTETKKTIQVGSYAFELVDATISTATIKVIHPLLGDVAECYIGGCSGQVCSDQKDVMSTCEFREEYACYRTATCERQSNGECGWTNTQTLSECLAS